MVTVDGRWATISTVVVRAASAVVSRRANLAGDTLDTVMAAAERGIQLYPEQPHLAFSFLRHCGLSLW